jgi:hypothetical protein
LHKIYLMIRIPSLAPFLSNFRFLSESWVVCSEFPPVSHPQLKVASKWLVAKTEKSPKRSKPLIIQWCTQKELNLQPSDP